LFIFGGTKNNNTSMKNNIIPVMLTAALTSVGTLFALKHFDKSEQLFRGNTPNKLPVNYVNYTADNQAPKAAPIDLETQQKAV
jgi:hypothetical protein